MENTNTVYIKAEVVAPTGGKKIDAGGFARGNQLDAHTSVVRALSNVVVNLEPDLDGGTLKRYGSAARWLQNLAQTPSMPPLAEDTHDRYFLQADGQGGYTAYPTAGLPLLTAADTAGLQRNFPEVAEALARGEIVRITPLFGKDRSDVKDWQFLGC